jgi:N-acetyl-anhydromuramyl-L-alanine amidase AmpD
MYTIQQHKLTLSLYPRVAIPPQQFTTPNYSKGRTIRPDTIIIHYTAGASALSTVNYCSHSNAQVSYHVVISRNGAVYQQVSFNLRAWHAGKSVFLARPDCNSYSIGIALANWGPLRRLGPGLIAAWPGDYTHFLPTDTPVFQAYHKHLNPPYNGPAPLWEPYPARQIFALRHVLRALIDHYPIEWIAGHDDVAPGRKMDPGPAFPLLPIQPRDQSILTTPASMALAPISTPSALFKRRYYCPDCQLHFTPTDLSEPGPAGTEPHEPYTYCPQVCPLCAQPLSFLA